MEILYGKIANGVDDVAKYLDLIPEKTIFMHSTSFDEQNPKNIKRKAINKGRMLYAEVLSYSSNAKNGAKTAIAHYNKDLLNYYENIGFLSLNNVVQVGEKNKIDYPYNSVSKMLNVQLKKDENLRKSLNGYTIISSYLSEEDEENANLIGGNLLMGVKEQERFNSKYEFRKISEKHGFSIPKGEAFLGAFNINKAINNLKNKLETTKNINVWIKLESQTSGTGNIFVEDVFNANIQSIENKVLEVGLKIYSKEYILNDMPLVIEVDVNSLNNEKEIENIGVEAVIANNKVTILGGVSQVISNGSYAGNQMTESTYKYINIAQDCAKDAFVAFCKEGYRGFITIDVLVTLNKETGKINAYNIDPNARFSAGTMLLKTIHLAEEKTNKKVYGVSFANLIDAKENFLDDIKKASENFAYNKNSNGCGFIPALVNDVTILNENKYYLKSVLVDVSYDKCVKDFESFKQYFRK